MKKQLLYLEIVHFEEGNSAGVPTGETGVILGLGDPTEDKDRYWYSVMRDQDELCYSVSDLEVRGTGLCREHSEIYPTADSDFP